MAPVSESPPIVTEEPSIVIAPPASKSIVLDGVALIVVASSINPGLPFSLAAANIPKEPVEDNDILT